MSDKQSSKHAHNRVFIASKTPMETRESFADDALTLHVGKRNLHVHAASNHLHVYLQDYKLSIIGLRVPGLEGREEIDAYWGWFSSEVNKLIDRKIILIGDFNADPLGNSLQAKHLASLIAGGWQTKEPTGEDWSYIDQRGNGSEPSRIDHVLSSHVEIQTAEYIIQRGRYNFMENDWSDHAILFVNLDAATLSSRTLHLE